MNPKESVKQLFEESNIKDNSENWRVCQQIFEIGYQAAVTRYNWLKPFSLRVQNVFYNYNIKDVYELKDKTETQLLRIKNFGSRCMEEVKDYLQSLDEPIFKKGDKVRERHFPNITGIVIERKEFLDYPTTCKILWSGFAETSTKWTHEVQKIKH